MPLLLQHLYLLVVCRMLIMSKPQPTNLHHSRTTHSRNLCTPHYQQRQSSRNPAPYLHNIHCRTPTHIINTLSHPIPPKSLPLLPRLNILHTDTRLPPSRTHLSHSLHKNLISLQTQPLKPPSTTLQIPTYVPNFLPLRKYYPHRHHQSGPHPSNNPHPNLQTLPQAHQ